MPAFNPRIQDADRAPGVQGLHRRLCLLKRVEGTKEKLKALSTCTMLAGLYNDYDGQLHSHSWSEHTQLLKHSHEVLRPELDQPAFPHLPVKGQESQPKPTMLSELEVHSGAALHSGQCVQATCSSLYSGVGEARFCWALGASKLPIAKLTIAHHGHQLLPESFGLPTFSTVTQFLHIHPSTFSSSLFCSA